SSGPRGTSKGTCFSARVRLARTMRWATVASGTRNARAISSVVRPPSRRSVSATRDSVGRTGWQAVNTRRRRSSPMSSRAASRSGAVSSCWASSSRPISSCLRSIRLLRRTRSIARYFAVAMSQAPGLFGTPDSGHCSSAATRASCARSSARPTSRTTRARPAMSLADSIRQTAAMVRCVSEAVMATDYTTTRPPVQAAQPLLLLRAGLCPQALLLPPEFGRERGAEVLRLEHLANLDLGAVVERGALEPLDRLFLRLHLPQPEARDQLLRLGEGPV